MNSAFRQIHRKRIHQKHQKELRTLFLEKPPSLLNFSSTDFLSLVRHPFVKEKAIDYAIEWGNGCYSFRHIDTYAQKHSETEKSLSALLGMPETLLLESHPLLFTSLMQSLTTPKTIILKSDTFPQFLKSSAPIQPFQTEAIDHLKYLLQIVASKNYNNILILIDSLSTCRTNSPSLKEFKELAHEFQATLIVDDSQTIGALGKHGMGLSAGLSGADLIFGNFGKAFGNYASYLACSEELKNFICFHNPLFQNLSPLPPFLLGLLDGSLSLIPSMSMERNHLQNRAKELRLQMKRGSYSVKDCHSHVLSLIFNHPAERTAFKNHITDCQCIPFLSHSPLQLDFFLSLTHSEQDLNKFIQILRSYRSPLKYSNG